MKNAQKFLDEPFIVIIGDAMTDIDLNKVIVVHKAKRSKLHLPLYRVPNPHEYGVNIVEDEVRIQHSWRTPLG